MKLIFIRHGDPDYSIDSLTPKGWHEADLLADFLDSFTLDYAFCSPHGRAKDTAKETLRRHSLVADECEWLREFSTSASLIHDTKNERMRIPWDLMPAIWTEQHKLFSKDEWCHAPVMQGSNIKNEYDRVCKCFDNLLEQHGYKRNGGYYKTENGNRETLIFFCHLGSECVFLSHLLNTSPSQLWQGFFPAPSSFTILESEEREKGNAYFRCRTLGGIAHLVCGNEPASNRGFKGELFEDEEDR